MVETVSRAIGVCTNNVAEYRALLAGLELAQKAGAEELEVLADSELLVKQVRGEYKVKNEGLKPLHAEASGAAPPVPTGVSPPCPPRGERRGRPAGEQGAGRGCLY